MPAKYVTMSDALYAYVLGVAAQETPLQRGLREETAQLPEAAMQIAPDQGQFMAWLIRLIGARRTLEIGVFTGYSTLWVAAALPDDGQIIACDVSEAWTRIARRYWEEAGLAQKIDLRLGPAIETLDALLAAGEAEAFDFAFIDADKENYDGYYERCLQLLRPGGVIAVDNMLWSGQVADVARNDASTTAIRALNAKVSADSRVTSSLLSISDGVLLAQKWP